ncbi:hypothetical protein [Phytobacter sp. AG2a]
MTTPRRMLELSPEEIRKISEKAVDTVAAQKIVTKTSFVNASLKGEVSSKSSSSKAYQSGLSQGALARRLDNSSRTYLVQAGNKLSQRARSILESAMSESKSNEILQKSFNKAIKDNKK